MHFSNIGVRAHQRLKDCALKVGRWEMLVLNICRGRWPSYSEFSVFFFEPCVNIRYVTSSERPPKEDKPSSPLSASAYSLRRQSDVTKRQNTNIGVILIRNILTFHSEYFWGIDASFQNIFNVKSIISLEEFPKNAIFCNIKHQSHQYLFIAREGIFLSFRKMNCFLKR